MASFKFSYPVSKFLVTCVFIKGMSVKSPLCFFFFSIILTLHQPCIGFETLDNTVRVQKNVLFFATVCSPPTRTTVSVTTFFTTCFANYQTETGQLPFFFFFFFLSFTRFFFESISILSIDCFTSTAPACRLL